MAEEDLELNELAVILAIAFVGVAVLVVLAFIGSGDIALGDWNTNDWASIGIVVVIVVALFVAIFLGSDEEGEAGGVFAGGFGFPLTVLVLLFGLLMVQTNFFGLQVGDPVLIDIDGDGTGDVYDNQIPDGYVDYGTPQPYGWGTYGPPNDGLLTDGEGALAGCATGAAGGLALGLSTAPLTAGIGIIGGPILGCLAGGGIGFGLSSIDIDGDPTTGW
tara:strand:+ start:33355 stop:34008 length:654 start_codon:yes stop_codon:yes gene_type:complete